MPGSAVRTWLIAAGLYALVTALFWLPTFARFGTDFVGDGGDSYQFVWNAWWLGWALETGRNPLFCDMQFAPHGVPLVLHTLAPLPALLIAGLSRIVGPVAGYNLGLFALCVGAGLGCFGLARYLTRDARAAWVAGLVFAVSPFLTSKLLGHTNLLAAGLLPVYLWQLLVALEDGRRGRVGLSVALVALLFSNVHMTIFAANLTVWLWLYRGCSGGGWWGETRRFAWALAPGIAVGLLWAGVVAWYAWRYGIDAEAYRAHRWCPEPLHLVLPYFGTSLWRDVLPQNARLWEMLNIELAVYVGLLVFPCAALGWWRGRGDRTVRFLVIAFVLSAALALGYRLQCNRELVLLGGGEVRMPMNAYRHLPVLGAVGQSGRYMVIGYLALAVGVACLLRGRGGRRGTLLCAAVTLAVLIDYAYVPQMVTPPARVIPAGPGRMLDPRIGLGRTLYRQTRCGRPLIGGYVARVPQALRDALAAEPVLGWFFLAAERRGPPPAGAALREALRAAEVSWVLVDPESVEADACLGAGLRLVSSDRFDAIFTVPAE